MKTRKNNIKTYTAEQVFRNKTKEFKRGYDEESARIALAKRIREEREKKKLTQVAVAQKAAMPQSVIARLESGEHAVSVETLTRVATALGKRVQLV